MWSSVQGQIGGYGFSVRTDPVANKYRFAGYLLPEWETADLLYQFYNFIMGHCLGHSPTAFICGMREDELLKKAWLEGQGFQPVMRYPSSILDVNDFDPTGYTALRAKIDSRGIEIVSLEELAMRESDWQRKIYDLEMLLNQDVPRPSTYKPPPFEKYAQREFEDPNFLPEGWLVALDGDRYIGVASLVKPGGSTEIMVNGLTGVHRDYRRLGLATVLKCQVIEVARQLGTRRLQTYNEENNPMYQINLRLGYVPQPADVDWEKSLV